MARGRKIRNAGHYKAIEHIRQRDELSRLVHGIDKEVLDIFFRFDSAVIGRLAIMYRQLFGATAELYMLETLPVWRVGKTTVSGRNAARLLMVVPLFLNDQQREALTGRLRGLVWDDHVAKWICGQNSAVRDRIKVVAEPKAGVTLPTLPDCRSAPPKPQFSHRAVLDRPASAIVCKPPRLPDLPSTVVAVAYQHQPAQATVQARPGSQSQHSGRILACITVLIIGILCIVAQNSTPPRPSSSSDVSSLSPTLVVGSSTPTQILPSSGQVPTSSLPSFPLRPNVPQVHGTPANSLSSKWVDPPPPQPQATEQMNLEVKYVSRPGRRGPGSREALIGGCNADGTLWALSQAKAVALSHSGRYEFFASTKGLRVRLDVKTNSQGNLVLQTHAGGPGTNRFLDLPEFPAVARGAVTAAPSSTPASETTTLPAVASTASIGSTATGTVNVRGHSRQNGTYVRPYTRSK